MFQDRTDEYRAWAVQCWAMAARAKTDEDKRPWLELAEKWQRLAEQVAPAGPAQQARQPQPQTEALPGTWVRGFGLGNPFD